MTDVAGVAVGYATILEGHGALRVGEGPVRTGVTALLPRGRSGLGQPCATGLFSLNGNGEMTFAAWIEESGGSTCRFSSPTPMPSDAARRCRDLGRLSQ